MDLEERQHGPEGCLVRDEDLLDQTMCVLKEPLLLLLRVAFRQQHDVHQAWSRGRRGIGGRAPRTAGTGRTPIHGGRHGNGTMLTALGAVEAAAAADRFRASSLGEKGALDRSQRRPRHEKRRFSREGNASARTGRENAPHSYPATLCGVHAFFLFSFVFSFFVSTVESSGTGLGVKRHATPSPPLSERLPHGPRPVFVAMDFTLSSPSFFLAAFQVFC